MRVNAKLRGMAALGLLLTGVVLGFVLSHAKPGHAEDEPEPLSSVENLRMVAYGTGITGFFDPETGLIYLYDSNLVNCLAIRELEVPGEPMRKIKG